MPVLELESRGRSRATDPAAETGPVGTPDPAERAFTLPASPSRARGRAGEAVRVWLHATAKA